MSQHIPRNYCLTKTRELVYKACLTETTTRKMPSAKKHISVLLIFPFFHIPQYHQVAFSSPFLESPLSQDMDFALVPTLPNAETAVFCLFCKKEKSYVSCISILQALCILVS